MKKIALALTLAILSAAGYAQHLSVDGEVKTGLFWNKFEDGLYEPELDIRLGSKDDAGSGHGRFRINMEYVNESGAMGFKVRLNWENWAINNPRAPDFPYAFGYGNFFGDQLTISLGILGSSPWGTGGPEMWRELDVSRSGGMRFEWKPTFVPGELNVGFVLNYFNSPSEAGNTVKLTMWEILKETVFGIAYTHDYFHARFAYRLDSDYDQRVRGAEKDGDDLVYRLEERVLHNYLPGFQIWALGFFAGIGAEEECFASTNWLFAEYAPGLFNAQIRFGMDVVKNRTILYLRPNFYWNFFNKFVVAGAAFQFGQDFGEGKVNNDAPYSHIEIEPKVQLNFSPNAYAAFAYNWRREYVKKMPEHTDRGKQPITQNQWMNLFMGLTF